MSIAAASGCTRPDAPPVPTAPGAAAPAKAPAAATLDEVRSITAQLMKSDLAKISADTSLADLGADELDYVELILELEEHFKIDIPDNLSKLAGDSKQWPIKSKNVTMSSLAALVEAQKKK